ncbi:MAG: hypothetical protein AB1668_01960 [Nanoarchaeota archaeon]
MDKKTRIILLSAIFIVTLVVRLILAFLMPGFTYDSYFHLRQVEQIATTGLPVFQDDLSYGGREIYFLPFFHYLMALFSFFLPLTLVAKILPNVLLASITIIVYLISKKITDNETAALFSALITGFMPIIFYTNSFSIDALFLPLTFITIYAFINIRKEMARDKSGESLKEYFKKRKYIYLYLASFLLISVTSSLAFLVIIGFIIYILLSIIEGKKVYRGELEIIIFSIFFYLWVQFLFFKKSLILRGISFAWQNVPSAIFSEYFPQFSIAKALVTVSIIPFLAGIYVTYKSLFRHKNQKSFLLISLVISTFLLTWLRLIKYQQALAFFGLVLAILFASFYHELDLYVRKTKFSRLKKLVVPITIILLLFSTALPAVNTALNQDMPKEEEIAAFAWLSENSVPNSVILSTLEEGHLVTYYSKRKNVMDDQFRLVEDVEERFKDVKSLYTTPFQTQALGLTDKYNIKYLVLTPSAKEKYGLEKFNYLTSKCFRKIYNQKADIYEVKCTLKSA